jgi:CubicO group peptidase (beta-lactamase class C family)
MLARRAFLIAGSAGLIPLRASSQDRSRIRDVLAMAMREHRVPGASVALMRDGEIAERVAIGADAKTLFQAASISKVVTGIAVLRLVEQGRIALDAPVNTMLRSWSLPGDDAQAVTPRLLLSHRAGTTVPGFAGYAVGAPLPTLEQILDGKPPANSSAVRVAWPPGQAFRYSGGGTMVLQRLAMDVTGSDFDRLANELVLAPAAMARSGFFQPLTAAEGAAAVAHDVRGGALAGGFHVYPEHAAAGLWSTPTDLIRLAQAIAASWQGGGLLSRASARAMVTPVGGGPTGLGCFVQTRGTRPPYVYHYGVNAGFRSVLVFAADASFGVALTANGDGGRQLIPEVLAATFGTFGQDPFKPMG